MECARHGANSSPVDTPSAARPGLIWGCRLGLRSPISRMRVWAEAAQPPEAGCCNLGSLFNPRGGRDSFLFQLRLAASLSLRWPETHSAPATARHFPLQGPRRLPESPLRGKPQIPRMFLRKHWALGSAPLLDRTLKLTRASGPGFPLPLLCSLLPTLGGVRVSSPDTLKMRKLSQ